MHAHTRNVLWARGLFDRTCNNAKKGLKHVYSAGRFSIDRSFSFLLLTGVYIYSSVVVFAKVKPRYDDEGK
jgi:hypothetical protein